MRLVWPASTGKSYEVLSTMDLGETWTTFVTDPAILVAAGEELSVEVPVEDAVRFFRVVELPDEPDPLSRMVWIEPGTFVAGSPESERGHDLGEDPQREVTLRQGFWLGKYEVTQSEYLGLMGTNPSHFQGDLDRPVERVSWDDATAYCEALTERERSAGRLPEGYDYELPNQWQWEYACRAGTTTRFSFGDALECSDSCGSCAEMDRYMVWCGNANGQTARVGTRQPNPWGLYDMHGNVHEWCANLYGTFPPASATGPRMPIPLPALVFRGGSWRNGATRCRSASFDGYLAFGAAYDLGFRVALVPIP